MITPEQSKTIKKAMIDNNLDQKDLAKEVGVSSTTMSFFLLCRITSKPLIAKVEKRLNIKL